MRVIITIEVDDALEEFATLEEIEALLVANGSQFTWVEEE